MNTKANAPAATKAEDKSAPTAKRSLAQLQAIISGGDWNEDDMKEFQQVAAENKQKIHGRKTRFTEISEMVGELHSHTPITKEEFFAMVGHERAAHFAGLLNEKKGRVAKPKAAGSGTPATARDSANNAVVMTARKFEYKIGRIYEDGVTGKKTADMTKAAPSAWVKLPKALVENATTEKQLMTLANEEGKKYFAGEGKEEMKAILAYAHSHADYKAAQATKGESAKAA